MKRSWLLVLVSLFLGTSACSGAGEEPDDDVGDDDVVDDDDDDSAAGDDDADSFDPQIAEALDAALEAVAVQYESPGIAAAILTGDGRLWAGASGVADVGDQTPLQTDDAFKIASVTKTFTAAVVLQLVGEGTLTIEDTLEQWYPDFERGEEITLRHLLMHTSGIADYSQTAGFAADPDGPWTDEQLVELVADQGLLFDPGVSYFYSNTNYVLLSLAIETATADAWRSQFEHRLLSPLSLDDTRVPGPDEDWGEIVSGYIGDEDYTDYGHPSGGGAAGSMVSNVNDVATWSLQYFGRDVLQPSEAALLVEDPYDFGSYAYGLGLLIIDDDMGTQWGHTGGSPGYSAWAGYRPGEDMAIAVLANSWWVDPDTGAMDYDWAYNAGQALWETILPR